MSAKEDFEKWLVETGLYKANKLQLAVATRLADAISASGLKLDCHCPDCKRQSVFTWSVTKKLTPSMSPLMSVNSKPLPKNYEFERIRSYLATVLAGVTFDCARDGSHQLWFMHRVVGDYSTETVSIAKVGQFPSPFDLLSEELQNYAGVLEPSDLRELKSADICTAHGLHVAAFTYLRRVFERRLDVAHAEAQKDVGWDQAAYGAARFMEEKIDLLQHHLPEFLVQNRKLYNVLSTGVHELTEQQCADGYGVSRLGVTLILDEEIERRARAAKIKEAGPSIQKLQEKFNKK
jgi:hypothetical protein